MLKLISYTRVSTEDQADYGTGLETQELENALFARRMEAHIVGVESDPGVSGTIYPRPGLERALQRIEAGEAHGLLVHRVDRVGRKVYIPALVFDRLQHRGARLLTVQDGEVTNNNILFFSVRCGMAQSDHQQLVTNMYAGKRRSAEKGKQPNRNSSAYGYHVFTKLEAGIHQELAGTYEVVDQQAIVIQRIFREYAGGASYQAICNMLQADGVPTASAARKRTISLWQPGTISRILSNPIYKGVAVWGKYRHEVRDKSKLPLEEQLAFRVREGVYRRKVLQPEEMHIHIAVPPIIDEALWEKCQDRRRENKLNTDRNDRRHLLSGVVFCPTCNRRLVVASGSTDSKNPYVGYRCRQTSAKAAAAAIVCEKKLHAEKAIFADLVDKLKQIASDPEFAAVAYADYVGAASSEDIAEQLQTARQRLEQLHATEEATTTAYIKSIELGTRAEIFESKLREISAERGRLEKQIADLSLSSIKQRRGESVDMGAIAQSVAAELLDVLCSDRITPIQKNGLLRRMVQSIYPKEGGGYEVTLRPFSEAQGAEKVVLVTVIDTAECYAASEELIGNAVAGRRNDFYLFTKCGHASGIDLPDWDPQLLEQSIDRSLKRLQTDHLDLVQLHTCSEEKLRQGEVIEVLKKAQAAGKTRYIGYSGDSKAALYAVQCGAFDTLQTSVSLADQECIDLTLPEAVKNDVGVIAKRPIANAVWRTGSKPDNGYVHTYWDRLQALDYAFLKGDLTESIATALRFTLTAPGVHTAIVGTANPDRWSSNADLARRGKLPAEEFEAIRARWHAVAKPDWIGQA